MYEIWTMAGLLPSPTFVFLSRIPTLDKRQKNNIYIFSTPDSRRETWPEYLQSYG